MKKGMHDISAELLAARDGAARLPNLTAGMRYLEILCGNAHVEIERLRAECLRLSHAEAEAMALVLGLEDQVGKLRAALADSAWRP